MSFMLAAITRPLAAISFDVALACGVVALVAFASSAMLTPVLARLALRLGVTDTPGLRKVHSKVTPYFGGVAVVAAILIACAFASWKSADSSIHVDSISPALWSVFGGAAAIFLLGLIDDIVGLRARYKLVAQLLVAGTVWTCGVRVETVGLGVGLGLDLGSFSLIFTVLWIVGVTNALNLIDGIDGLAGGIGAIAATALALLAIQAGDLVSAGMLAALAGALSGFLVHNFHPARVFLGDSGSLTLGFLLATCSITSSGKSATFLSILVPIAALGVPIFDTAFSMLRRALERRSIFSPDRNHIHHRMLDRGLGQRRVVLWIYAETALACGIGLGAMRMEPWTVALAVLAVVAFHVSFFRAVGSVRLRESLHAFRRTREFLRRSAAQRQEYETLQLHMREAVDLDAWWFALQLAADRLGFAQLEIILASESSAARALNWERATDRATVDLKLTHVAPEGHREMLVRAKLVTEESLESVGRRFSLFGRLLDEYAAFEVEAGTKVSHPHPRRIAAS